MEPQQQILEKAEGLFMRLGVKSVSMDDVARELGISKKTLYQYFPTKEDLIVRTLEFHRRCERDQIAEVLAHADNALDEMVSLAKMAIRQLQKISPSLIFDLKKYHPDAFRFLEESHRKEAFEHIRQNLEKGISQGLYLPGIHVDIMARIHVQSFNLLLDEQLFPEDLPRAQILREYIMHYLRGLVTPVGLQYLEKYMHI